MSRMLPWKRFPWNVEKGERGAALVWLSLMLTFLIGAAAFAVDLGWLYVNSSRIQRTADAAALGGVTFMPSFPAIAQSTAVDVASANGYVVGTNATIGYPPPPEDYQFSVSITSPVETFLLRIFGQSTVTMTRQATAEYVLPLPMGSPENFLGGASSEFWMAIQAPKTRREYGDPYATQCLLNDGYDQSACDPSGSTNPWYRAAGYYIGVELPTGSSGLDIQLYDAGFYEGSIFNDTGDYGWNLGYGARTTFRVYEPDLTPLDLTDNPLATCNLGYGPVETLDPEDTTPNTEGAWTRLCTINSTVPGRYLVQVSTDNIGHAIEPLCDQRFIAFGTESERVRDPGHVDFRQLQRQLGHFLPRRSR